MGLVLGPPEGTLPIWGKYQYKEEAGLSRGVGSLVTQAECLNPATSQVRPDPGLAHCRLISFATYTTSN